jgi:CcmD family protein
MSDLTWMFIAFLAVWAGIGLYLFSLGTRQRKLERKLADIEHRAANSTR